ncbi:IucA/IucC family protein [Metabacillus fastidiosus]|uniref:IucA/IucC family protein n=1 Tax=Metabacillus fastidiosus TaxID=1458 RepID=UPI003D26D649
MNALQSEQYVTVRRRVFKQLIESMIFEGIIIPEETRNTDGYIQFHLKGQDEQLQEVTYLCSGRRRMTFGRIRLTHTPVIRESVQSKAEAVSLTQFVKEVLKSSDINEVKLQAFANELEQTLLNDTLAQFNRFRENSIMMGKSYDELERDMTDGHPYHPSYKSRIGFSYEDNYMYGPEFKQPIQLYWVALHRSCSKFVIADGMSFEDLMEAELGREKLDEFHQLVKSAGGNPFDYYYLPVHPWQWKKHIVTSFASELRSKKIILLGKSEDVYYPQQSIRTLANQSNPKKPYVKLSMNLINTSSPRTILPTFIESAPQVSAWLQDIVLSDSYLREEARLTLLQEFAGVTFHLPAKSSFESSSTIGSIGCIWRSSIHCHLEKDEQAIPFNAVFSFELTKQPFIDPWIRKYGIEKWLVNLLEVSVLPIIHLAIAHGIALETHAQNMVLIHKEGMPTRIALKDFHEDVLFCQSFLRNPEKCPSFAKDTDFEVEDVSSVRVLTLGALFFVNLAELALLLADQYDFREETFWGLCAKVIERHHHRFPDLSHRFNQFNIFTPTTMVEQLTKRRLYTNTSQLSHEVYNPLEMVKAQQILPKM